MSLTHEQAKVLIEMVKTTRDHEMTCDECLAEIAEFVEARLGEKPLSQVLQTVLDHLETCPNCNEEYRVLRQAVEAVEEES